jgi:hypothetical protein
MILSISWKKLCSGFGRADIGYVNYEIIEHFITVTFPYNAKFLLPQERTILFIFSFVSPKLYRIRPSVFPFTELEKCGIINVFTRGLRHYKCI